MSLRIQRKMLCAICRAKVQVLDNEYMKEYRKTHKQKGYYKKVAARSTKRGDR